MSQLRARDPKGANIANTAALTRLRMELGDLAEARRTLETITAAMPQFATAWSNLGHAEFSSGDWQQAEQSLRKALFLHSGYCPAITLLAHIEESYGNDKGGVGLSGMCDIGQTSRYSRHSQRVARIYKLKRWVAGDDILPPGLAEYCSPNVHSGIPLVNR
jgi:Tfp pilus assembly protein PilF